ncbi:hypothetical protein [Streptomyces sp. NPDC001985]|uniref:hypothetical protein n=1 Tax=Streptomyces sp. NPDC001985 TaxID=3154406 RepID=UPI003323D127
MSRYAPYVLPDRARRAVVVAALALAVSLPGAVGTRASADDGAKVKYYIVSEQPGGEPEFVFAIAERTLGDGNRFQEIFELNKGRRQPDGKVMESATAVPAGWVLRLPPDARGAGVRFGALPGTAPATPAPGAPGEGPAARAAAPPSEGSGPLPLALAIGGSLATGAAGATLVLRRRRPPAVSGPAAPAPSARIAPPAPLVVSADPMAESGAPTPAGPVVPAVRAASAGPVVPAARAVPAVSVAEPGVAAPAVSVADSGVAAPAARVVPAVRAASAGPVVPAARAVPAGPVVDPGVASPAAPAPPVVPAAQVADSGVTSPAAPAPPVVPVGRVADSGVAVPAARLVPAVRAASAGPVVPAAQAVPATPVVPTAQTTPAARGAIHSGPDAPDGARSSAPIGALAGVAGTVTHPTAVSAASVMPVGLPGAGTPPSGTPAAPPAGGAPAPSQPLPPGAADPEASAPAAPPAAPGRRTRGRRVEVRRSLAPPLRVHFGDDTVDIDFGAGGPAPGDEAVVWLPVPYETPAGDGAFVCVGSAEPAGCLFLDLARAPGPVAVTGDPDAARRLLETLVLQLSAGPAPVHTVAVGRVAAEEGAEAAERLPSLPELVSRWADRTDPRLTVVFCALDTPEDETALARLRAAPAAPAAPFVPVVLGEPATPAAWRFTAREGAPADGA